MRLFLSICLIFLNVAVLAQRIPLLINRGQQYINERKVTLSLDFDNVVEAKLWDGLDSLDGAAATWRPYQKEMAWELPEGDGRKVVSVLFRSASKQQSEHFIAGITLDQTPPAVDSVRFGGPDGITGKTINNMVRVYSADNDIVSIMISNSPTFTNAEWQNYTPNFKWSVSGEDGEKELFIKVKDRAGNISDVYKASVTLDTTPPDGISVTPKHAKGVESPDGKLFINDPEKVVDLVLFANGASEMMISNDVSFYGAKWEPYQDVYKGWKLREGADGKHWVYAKFRDKVGNTSRMAKATIIADTQKPVILSVYINNGDDMTNKEEVSLSIESKGGTIMKVSNNPDFTGIPAEKYAVIKPWKLLPEEGPKSVFVVVIDSANNESVPVEAGIILDKTPPKPLGIRLDRGAKRTRSSLIDVETTADGAVKMQYSQEADFKDAHWMPYKEEPFEIPIEGKGMQTIHMRFMDEVGNISAVIKDSIIAEVIPHFEGFTIDDRAIYCIHPDGEVTISIKATRAAEMMFSNQPHFRKSVWQPFSPTATWKLEGPDGEKTVYVKVRSETQTESDTLSASIVFDRTKPHDCQITLNNGEDRSRLHDVAVEVKAQDAKYMAISTSPTFRNTEWRNYDFEPFIHSFGVEYGWQTIYAQFKDDKGNISEVVKDSVLLELVPTNGIIKIENGEDFCTDKGKQATIHIQAKHATEMMFSNTPDFAGGTWVPYSNTHKWTLAGEDGEKTVYAKFRSFTGTPSEEPVSDDVILDRNPPYDCSFNLSTSKAGEALPSQYISVGAVATDAKFMQISPFPDFALNTRIWMRYTDEPFLYRVGPQDGKRTFYMRFKDDAGNISPTISHTVFIDREMPRGIHFFAADSQYAVKDPGVMLVAEGKGASQMRLSGSPVFEGIEWMPFRERMSWHLGDEDGFHQVFLQVQDSAGNASHPIGLRFKLDREPPTEPFIDIQEEYCNTEMRTVNLKLRCYGASRMMISQSPDFSEAVWEKTKPAVRWRLADADGKQAIYVKFADEAGNESEVMSDEVLLDREAPAGRVTINDGAAFTDNWDASLEIYASGATEMIISGEPKFVKATGWIPYEGAYSWKLDGGLDGMKYIYVKFRDEAMNESVAYTDSIELDTREPLMKRFAINGGATAVKGSEVTLNITAEGAKYMMVSNDPELVGAGWEPYFAEKTWLLMPGEGLKEVFVRLKDEHGHETRIFSARITSYDKTYKTIGN